MASESPASDLDELVDILSERSGVRVDRGVRTSSVVSTLQGGSFRSAALLPMPRALPKSRPATSVSTRIRG